MKEDVKKLAISNERAKLVSELATKLAERADKGEAMEALAKEGGAPKLDTTPPFTRTTEPQGLSKTPSPRPSRSPRARPDRHPPPTASLAASSR